jgi:signal transduction histidine kinase
MKKGEVVKLAERIEMEYKRGDFLDFLDNIAYKNASNIYIYNSQEELIYTSVGLLNQNGQISGQNGNNSGSSSRFINIDKSVVLKKIKENASNKISETLELNKPKTELYVYGKLIEGTDNYLVMVASIDPIDTTTSVLKSQLVYVTIIALLISSIISIFISRRLSRPILKITQSAKKLSKGCYDVEFEKGGYAEVDELADTLNAATKELGNTDKVRKELIANVSHDLRTPLTMIKAYSEMIRDLSGNDKIKREEHLKVIIDETDRLSRLVDDMMDLSKIESGNIALNKTRFNINEVVENIVNGFKILEQDKKSEFKITVPKEAFVMADKTKIEQVIYNLMINAVNHTGKNKKIEAKITTFGKRIKVQIKDNGIGISKENLPNIWTRYYKVDKTYKRTTTGSGLGLSIVKNILEKHNSNYGVESEVGKGSVFYFDLEKAN